jgi:hypothetical protein
MSVRLRRMAVVVTVLGLIGCNQSVDPRHKMYPKGVQYYRLLKEGDFCSELPLFAQPDPNTMIGTVLDGAQRYVDPRTGRELRAILVLTVVNNKRVDRWYPREKLVGSVYVLRNDPSFGNCGYWLDEEKPVKPLPSEIAADVSGSPK